MLARMAEDLLRLLTIVDMGAGVVYWALAFRERVLMASHAPEWRGWFTLRRVTADEYSRAYRAHFHRSLHYAFAFFIIICIAALLILLDHLFFKRPLC